MPIREFCISEVKGGPDGRADHHQSGGWSAHAQLYSNSTAPMLSMQVTPADDECWLGVHAISLVPARSIAREGISQMGRGFVRITPLSPTQYADNSMGEACEGMCTSWPASGLQLALWCKDYRADSNTMLVPRALVSAILDLAGSDWTRR